MTRTTTVPKIDKLPRMTSREKVDSYGELIIWSAIPGQTRAINFVSPCNHTTGEVAPGAGNSHTIRWDENKGRWVCSCEAGCDGRTCWHLSVWEVNLWWFIECGTICFESSPEPISAAETAALWGN